MTSSLARPTEEAKFDLTASIFSMTDLPREKRPSLQMVTLRAYSYGGRGAGMLPVQKLRASATVCRSTSPAA